MCPQLVVKTKYIDTLIKLLLTYLLTYLVTYLQGSFISHYLYKVNMERKVRLQLMITR